jgi:cation transport ATPase
MENRQDEPKNLTTTRVAFYTILAVAAILLTSMILHFVGISAMAVTWLQAVGALILFIVTAMVGWQNCRYRNMFMQILYFLSLAAIIVSIVLPRLI